MTSHTTFKRKIAYLAVASCFVVTPAFGNPTGGVVTHGGATFNTQGNTLTVTNLPNSIINWQQFSIGPGELTRFVQQNAQSAVLNRVVGQDPSQILGQLLSNGRVFVINPNGVLFGAGSTVDVAGLVVSTLNMTDQDFLNGKLKFAGGDQAGNIVNRGELTSATGGQIYLIAPKIENSGIITSPQGEILLAAGHTVNLVDAANPEIQVSLTAPATEVVNIGQIVAQSGKIGLYASLISQQGLINADRAVQDINGDIILKAGTRVTLAAGSVTSAQGGGKIGVFADMQDGQVNVAGKLDASAPVDGNGGFIETSAAHVKIADTARITTKAAHGKTGTWLIDPNDFTISSGGDISGGTLSSQLDSTSITITSAQGATSGNGDIFVDESVSWSSDTTLTLSAARNIDIHQSITAYGSQSGLVLNATNGMVTVQPNTWRSGLGSPMLSVDIGGNITVNAGGLTVRGGAVTAGPESSRNANVEFIAGQTMNLNLGSGGLTVRGGDATANASGSGAQASANALVRATDININSSGPINVVGGNATAFASSGSTANAYANSTLQAYNAITVTNAGSITVQGGHAMASASYNYDRANAYASASMTADNIVVNQAGPILVQGGTTDLYGGGSSEASTPGNAYAVATALLRGFQDLTVTTSGLTVQGGTVNQDPGLGSAYGMAKASVAAGHEIRVTTSGTVKVLEGTVNGSGEADATVETVSVNTIFLTFTGLTCCGFSVNGVNDALVSTSGNSGFFADFGTAILNSNMFVTYLGRPSSDLLIYPNGAVNENGVGAPLWTFLGNSLQPVILDFEEWRKHECGIRG